MKGDSGDETTDAGPQHIFGGLPVRKKEHEDKAVPAPRGSGIIPAWCSCWLTLVASLSPHLHRGAEGDHVPEAPGGERVYYKNCTKKLSLTAWLWAGSHLDRVVAGLTRQRGPHAATADSVRGSSFAVILAVGGEHQT